MPVSKDEFDAYRTAPPGEVCNCCHGAECPTHPNLDHVLLSAEAEGEEPEELMVMVHDYLATMTPAERVEYLHQLRGNYCEHCGRLDKTGRGCACDNDE